MTAHILHALITRSPNWEYGVSLHPTHKAAATAMRDVVVDHLTEYAVAPDDIPADAFDALDLLHEYAWDGSMVIESATFGNEEFAATEVVAQARFDNCPGRVS